MSEIKNFEFGCLLSMSHLKLTRTKGQKKRLVSQRDLNPCPLALKSNALPLYSTGPFQLVLSFTWLFPASFSLFSSFAWSYKINSQIIFLAGFELRISDVGNDRSAICVTLISQLFDQYFFRTIS